MFVQSGSLLNKVFKNAKHDTTDGCAEEKENIYIMFR